MNERVSMLMAQSRCPQRPRDLFHALASSGMLTHMEQLHIEYLFTYNVDNPLAVVADPTYLGFIHAGSNLCFKLLTMTVTTNTLFNRARRDGAGCRRRGFDSGNDVLSLVNTSVPTCYHDLPRGYARNGLLGDVMNLIAKTSFGTN